MPTVLIGLLLAATALSQGGCRNSEKASSVQTDVPADLKIILGHNAAPAGRLMGYTIQGDGGAIRWEGKYPGENVEASGRLDEEAVRSLWKRIQEMGFLQMQQQVPGGVHWFVNVEANGDSRRVTWSRRDTAALTPVQQLYEDCRDLVEEAVRGSES